MREKEKEKKQMIHITDFIGKINSVLRYNEY